MNKTIISLRFRRPLLAAVFLTAAVFTQAAAPTVLDLRTQARAAFRAGNYDVAADLYQQLAQQEKRLSILQEAMWSLWNMHKPREALEVARLIESQFPSDPQAEKIIAWAPAAQREQEIRERQQAARAAYQQGNNAEAVRLYGEVAALDPQNPAAWRDYMWMLWNNDRVDDAMRTARKVQTLRPDDADAATVLRRGAEDRRRKAPLPEDTLAAVQAQLIKNPEDADAWYRLGRLQAAAGNDAEAVVSYEKSLGLDPGQSRVLVSAGKSYAELRDLDRAAAAFGRAYELAPSPEILPSFAKVLFYRGEFRRSMEMWSKTLEAYPDRDDYRFRQAEAAYYAGQRLDALEAMQQLAVHDRRALRFLIDDATAHQEKEAALRYLEQATEALSADKSRDVIQLSQLYEDLGKPNGALELTRRWLALYPDDIPVLLVRASTLNSVNRPAAAADVYNGILQRNPYVMNACLGLSESLFALGDKKGGVDALAAALALEPTNPYMLRRLVRAMFWAGRHDEARQRLTDWLNKETGNTTVLPILLYHGISANDASPLLAYAEHMTASNFENQMQGLAQDGYHAVTLAEVEDWQAGRKPLPDKPVLIAFDDARADSFQNADPVLKHYGLKATMFVPSENVDTSGALGYASWNTIAAYKKTGRWDIQAHGANAHSSIRTGAKGENALFLVMPQWLEGEGRTETEVEWRARVDADHRSIIKDVKEKTGAEPVGYAFPNGLYGQQSDSAVAVPLNRAAVRTHYRFAFIQDEFGMDLRDQDPYNMRRIEPSARWSGRDLIRHLKNKNPFALAYAELVEMSVEDARLSEARQWTAQLRAAGATNELLLVQEAKIENASNNPGKAYQLAMQVFIADPSPENQKLLQEMKAHLGVVWRPEASYQKDNQHRESWGYEQSLELPVNTHVRARAIQGMTKFSEEGVPDVRDNLLGAGVSMAWGDWQSVDASLRHHALSGEASDLWGYAAVYRARWNRTFQTYFDQRRELYGSAKAVNANIHENRTRAQLHWGVHEAWGLALRGRLSNLSDDNRRHTAEFDAGHNFFPRQGLGAVYHYIHDDTHRSSVNYYAPQQLQMHQVGPQFSQGEHTRWHWLARYLIGIADEIGSDQQFVQNASAFLEWSPGKNTTFGPSVEYEETPIYHNFLASLAFQHEF